MKLEQSTSGSSLPLKKPVSLKRCHSAYIYYRNPYSGQKTWKNMKKSWFFEGISSQTSPQTLAMTRKYCLGHFWWKIFSSIFQLLFWTIFFARFHQKSNDFHRVYLHYHAVFAHNHQVCFKKAWNFRRNWAKNMIQNRSWKIDENIFHEKCPKQHSLVTGSVCGDVWDDIPSKNHEIFMFFHVFWLL